MKKEDEIIEAFMKIAEQNPIEEGHELRFEKRLSGKAQVKMFSLSPFVLRIAAAAVLLVCLGLFWWMNSNEPKIADTSVAPAYPMEVIKAQAFYHSNAELDNSKLSSEDIVVKEFLEKLKTLESEFARLDSLYQFNQSNEQLIKGMIENFQFRLQVIHQLKTYIEIKNQSNQENNENAIG